MTAFKGSMNFLELLNRLNFATEKWDHVSVGRNANNSSTMFVDGSFGASVIATASSRTLSYDDHVVLVDTTSAPITLTLPTAVGITGRVYFIKRTSGGKSMATIATTSSQTIDGASNYYLPAQYHSICLMSDGANWMILF